MCFAKKFNKLPLLERAFFPTLLFSLYLMPITGLFAADGQTVSGMPGSVYVFHDGYKDQFLQIGDDAGGRSDIDGFLVGTSGVTGKSPDDLARFVGDEQEFHFVLEKTQKSATVEIVIFSVLQKNHSKYDCPSFLYVNNAEKFDLRDGDNVGGGKLTTFTTEVASLKKGVNLIKIKELGCKPSGMNDSLLVKGLIKFQD